MLFTAVPTGVFATEPTETEVPVSEETLSTEAGIGENTEPAASEPAVTEPTETEPVAAEPTVTAPDATEPEVTEPEATEHPHTYETQVIPPDCTNRGYTAYICACGDSYLGDYVDALGHDYQEGICTRCGVEASDPVPPVVTAENDDATGQIKLTWNAIDGAYCYMIYRATDTDDETEPEFELVYLTGETEYVDAGCELGVFYYYFVEAVDPEGMYSEPSEIVFNTCNLPAPEVQASNVDSTGKVRLTWKSVKGAVSYEVYRSISPEGNYNRVFTTSGTSYTNTKAVAGMTYYYKVRAIADNPEESSGNSEVISRLCNLPRPVVEASNAASTGKVRLTWEPIEGASCYMISWSDSRDGTYQMVCSTIETTYTHATAETGKLYYYKVMAVGDDLSLLSADSKAVYRTCDLPRTTITNATNDALTGNVQLTWEAVEGAVGYKVYRSDSADGSFKAVFSTTETSFTDTTAPAGVTYYYKIKALAENASANASLSKVRKRSADCTAPVISVAINGSGKPRVTWEPVEGALTYKVYRSDSENGTYKLMYNTESTSYSNSTAKVGVTYYYKVKAVGVDASSASSFSNAVSCAAIKNVYQYVFSSYSTSKYGTAGRNTNLALACKAINGTILAPGEKFSFNEVVGPRTEKKGYQMATVFNDVGMGRGGGVCQVATTLFNCALIGNLKITKRRQHSIAVTYVPLGRDATVYKKVKDFCFVNDSDYYIKIKASASGGTVSISFLTREANVSPKSKVKLQVTEKDGVYTLTRRYEGVVNYTVTSSYK